MKRGLEHAQWPPSNGSERADSSFETASQAVLFETKPPTECDICAAALERTADDEDSPLAPGGMVGAGAWYRSRGDVGDCERPPICGECAAAIGVTLLQRSISEEEEG